MHISFSPQRYTPGEDTDLAIIKQGDVLIINDDKLDLSGVTDGATLPGEAISCRFIAGDIERIDGDLHITLILPSRAGTIADPAPLIDPPDGPLTLPDCLTESDNG